MTEPPLSIVNGCAVLDQTPGSGVEWNEQRSRDISWSDRPRRL